MRIQASTQQLDLGLIGFGVTGTGKLRLSTLLDKHLGDGQRARLRQVLRQGTAQRSESLDSGCAGLTA